MRREWTVSEFQADFNHWHRLMKGEKYVCLGGSFIRRENKIVNGNKKIIYSWIYDRIKTKKGCAGYFGGCNFTREQYLKHEAETNKFNKMNMQR